MNPAESMDLALQRARARLEAALNELTEATFQAEPFMDLDDVKATVDVAKNLRASMRARLDQDDAAGIGGKR